MAKPELTAWFAGHVRPTLPGVYERTARYKCQRYSYWDGKCWGIGGASPIYAYRCRGLTSDYQKTLQWRGLAKDQNKEPTNDR